MSGSDYTTEKSEHITEKTECRLSLYNWKKVKYMDIYI